MCDGFGRKAGFVSRFDTGSEYIVRIELGTPQGSRTGKFKPLMYSIAEKFLSAYNSFQFLSSFVQCLQIKSLNKLDGISKGYKSKKALILLSAFQ